MRSGLCYSEFIPVYLVTRVRIKPVFTPSRGHSKHETSQSGVKDQLLNNFNWIFLVNYLK